MMLVNSLLPTITMIIIGVFADVSTVGMLHVTFYTPFRILLVCHYDMTRRNWTHISRNGWKCTVDNL